MPSFIELGAPMTMKLINAAPWRRQDLAERHDRMSDANDLIYCISERGRRLFSYGPNNENVSQFKLAQNGRLWFLDGYANRLIYTHYNGPWRHFTNGGTLRRLIQGLRDFIMTGKCLCGDLGPWPERHGNDRWAYGSDMELVRQKAAELRII